MRSILMVFVAMGAAQVARIAAEEERDSSKPPFEMPEMVAPAFPDRTFDIRNHGATADGLNTDAIARTIEECAAAGGGRVLIPEGTWQTGPVHLRSKVELHLAEGAVLSFSDRFEDYLPAVLVMRAGVEAYSYSPLIYAKDCENVAVTGKGTLQGNGKAWWGEMFKTERSGKAMQRLIDMASDGVPASERVFATRTSGLRPAFIQTIDCRGVLLADFTLRDGPAWNINPVRCENLIVRGISIIAKGPNNDGIDPEMCRNVLIEDCFIDTGDDCIAIKAGRDEEGWRMNRPTENVIIRRIRTARGHGGVVIGSEISGGVRNVHVSECHFAGTEIGLRIKTNPGRGGFVENVYCETITMEKIERQGIIVTMAYSHGMDSKTDRRTRLENLNFRDIQIDSEGEFVRIQGDAALRPKGLRFENVRGKAKTGFACDTVDGLQLDGVEVEQEKGEAFSLKNAENTVKRNLRGEGQP